MFIAGYMKIISLIEFFGTRPEIIHMLPDARFYESKRNINHTNVADSVYNDHKDSGKDHLYHVKVYKYM